MAALAWAGAASAQDAPGCALTETARAAGWSLDEPVLLDGAGDPRFLADRRTVRSSGGGNTPVRLWDTRSGRLLRELYPAATSAEGRSWDDHSPDERFELWSSETKPAQLWDMTTGNVVATLPIVTKAGSLAFSDSGSRIVLRTPDGRIEIRDGRTGALITSMQGAAGEAYVEVAPDAGSLLVNLRGGPVELWNVARGRLLATFPEDTDAKFNRTGERLVTAGPYGDRGRALWDAHTGQQLATGDDDDDLWSSRTDAPFTSDGALLLLANGERRVRVVDAATGATRFNLSRLAARPDMVDGFRVRVAPDGRTLIARTPEGEAELWDLVKARRIARLGAFLKTEDIAPPFEDPNGHAWTNVPQEFVFTPDGERLIARDRNGVLSLWNTRDGRMIRELGMVHDEDEDLFKEDRFTLSPGGGWIALRRASGTTQIWSTQDGRRAATPGRFDPLGDLTFSPDERLMVIEDDDHRQLWDLKAGVRLADLGTARISPAETTFLDDGTQLTLRGMNDADEPHTLLWDVRDGRVIADLGIYASLRHTPLGDHRLGVTEWAWQRDRGVGLWDIRSGEQLAACTGAAHAELVPDADGEQASLVLHWDAAAIVRLTPPR